MKNIPVTYISQKDRAATGCESVSTVMLLNWLGFDLTVEEFIDKYLDKKPMDYGPNPYDEFCGDPYDPDCFGCYAPVIAKALNRVFETETEPRFTAIDRTGEELFNLVKEYIGEKGMPLITWTTIDLQPVIFGPYWTLHDGTEFMWKSNEHCVLLTGYSEDKYIINDPWNDNGIMTVDRELFEKRYSEQDKRAVGIERK